MSRKQEALAIVIAGAALVSGCSRPGAVAVEAPMIGAEVVASSQAKGPSPAAPSRLLASPAASNGPIERGNRFRGHYWCAQGRTELTLVVEDIDHAQGSLVALFEFDYPGGPSHEPASGSYRMRGTFDTGSRQLRLKADRWIEQPDGYVMVDLVGTMSKTGSLNGNVGGPGCTTFYLDGVSSPAQPLGSPAP